MIATVLTMLDNSLILSVADCVISVADCAISVREVSGKTKAHRLA